MRDFSHFDIYPGIAALSDYHLYPFLDFWLEWPPLVPWLMVGAYKLALFMPVWPDDSRLWFVIFMGSVFVLFEVGNFFMLYRLAQRIWDKHSTLMRVLWFYACLFTPLFFMVGFFDGMALFFILLSLDLLLTKRPLLSAAAAALGVVVKVIPVLAIAVAFRYLWHQHHNPRLALNRQLPAIKVWLSYGFTFSATLLLLLLPFMIIAPEWLLAFGKALANRATWETIWAVLEGYYGYGAVAGDRLNAVETNFAIHHQNWLPWGIISLGFALLYSFIFWRKADYHEPRLIIAFFGLTLLLFLLYSKGYSPQFLTLILPFIILLMPNFVGLGYVLILELLNLLEQPVFFIILPEAYWLLTGVVTLRFIIFTALALEFARIIWPQTLASPWLIYGLRSGLTILSLVGFIAFIPLGWRSYQQTQLAHHPHKEAIQFLQTQATRPPQLLLLTQQSLYQECYPYLQAHYQLQLAGGDAVFPQAPTVADLLTDHTQVWLLATGTQGETVRQIINIISQAHISYTLADLGSITWYNLSGQPDSPPIVAYTENGITLQGYHLTQNPTTLTLTLYWHNKNPLNEDYTIFTHLLNERGQLVASHDSQPALGSNPTTAWIPTELIPDVHPIALPSDLQTREYQLMIGLYNAQGVRLPIFGPDDQRWANEALPLTSLILP